MTYTVICDGHSYDLPNKTISVMEKLEKVMKVDFEKGLTIKQKYQKLYDFTKEILGAENVAEILNGKTINDIDVGGLEILVLKIEDAYNEPISAYRTEKVTSTFEALPTDTIAKLTDVSKALTK